MRSTLPALARVSLSVCLLAPVALVGPGRGLAAAQDEQVRVLTSGAAPSNVDVFGITGGAREAVSADTLSQWLSRKPTGTRIQVYEKTMCQSGRTVVILKPVSETLPPEDARCVNKNATTGDPCGCDEIGSFVVGGGRFTIDTGARSVTQQIAPVTSSGHRLRLAGTLQLGRTSSDLGTKSCEPFKVALPFDPQCSSEDAKPAWGIGFDVTWRPGGSRIGINSGVQYGQMGKFRYENVATSGVQKVYNRGEVKVRTTNIRVGPSLGNDKVEVVPYISANRTVGEGTSSDERTVNGVKAAGESLNTRAALWNVGAGVAATFKVSEFIWIGANWNRIRSAAFPSVNRSRGPDRIRTDTISALIQLRYDALRVR